MADLTSTFDAMDDLTAQVCIGLQLADLTSLTSSLAQPTDPTSDQKFALKFQEDELKAYCTARGLPEPPPAPIKLVRCDCCHEDVCTEQSMEAPCNDRYCAGCLEKLFTDAMGDRTLYPPRCCRQHIPWETVRDIVSTDLAAQFEAKREELDDKTPLYCYEPRCSTYIKAHAKDLPKASCPTCHATTCTFCKQATHEGACPDDEEVQKMRDYAEKEGNQECSQCHQLVELSTGCNHITCLCRYEFCYCCGVQWKNCPCEQWDEARLVARAENVANRPGMGGAAAAPAIAQQLRLYHHDCDADGHGYMERLDGQITCDSCRIMQRRFIFRCYHCQIDLCHRCKNNRA